LKRFRPEELEGEVRPGQRSERDLDAFFQELESLSCGEGEESGLDIDDSISIGSTPKPSLRPFFASSKQENITGELKCFSQFIIFVYLKKIK
jgi:phosphofurin acidic cluster sorting protein 2